MSNQTLILKKHQLEHQLKKIKHNFVNIDLKTIVGTRFCPNCKSKVVEEEDDNIYL